MNNYPQDFENLWAIYPKRAGGNPKKKAYRAYMARLKDSCTHMYMYCGLDRYSAFCEATGKIGTEYVMQACTFFGPDEHYEEDWAIPVGGNNGTHQKTPNLSASERTTADRIRVEAAGEDNGKLVGENDSPVRA